MRSYAFTIPGGPVPQPRQRHAFIKGKPRNYVPRDHPIHAYKDSIRLLACRPAWDLTLVAVEMRITFVLPRVAGLPAHESPCTKRVGDVDNFAKAVMDALTGICYADDSQVYHLTVEKLYAAAGANPCTRVLLSEPDD